MEVVSGEQWSGPECVSLTSGRWGSLWVEKVFVEKWNPGWEVRKEGVHTEGQEGEEEGWEVW